MKNLLISILVLSTLGCSVRIKTVNQRKNPTNMNVHTELSTHANNYFWECFHNGDYSKIDSLIYYLSASYNENPNHLETVSHLGFVHMWALSERQKLDVVPPTITEHGTLALKYYGESHRLNPHDPRVLGFLSDAKMIVGNFSDDKKLSKEGYFNGKKAIKKWSEFNYFTIGYVLSQLYQDSWQFDKGLEWQWKTLDECYCEKFDRENPSIEKYLPMEANETNLKRKRTCWNSWIVPHNVEGFYLNMGDMLVKDGNWEKAIEIYMLAKQVPEYDSWPYKDFLERRITAAKSNVEKFRMPIDNSKKYKDDDVMLINSSISCMACHKMSKEDHVVYKDFDWMKYKAEKNVYWLNR